MSDPRYGLVLDIQASQSAHYAERGIGRFVVEHARALLAYPGLVRQLGLNPLMPFPGSLHAGVLSSPLLSWNTATAFREAECQGPLAYYIMSPFEWDSPGEAVVPPHAMRPDVPLIVTLYDLIPLVMSKQYLQDSRMSARYQARLDLLRCADLVSAISEHTRRDALRLLDLDPRRVSVVGGGVSPFFQPASVGPDPFTQVRRTLPQIERAFVLCVSGADDRKNTEALITAFAKLPVELRAAYQLVIACQLPASFKRKWREHARAVGLDEGDMVLTSYVSDEVLRALYQATTLFVFPSLYEGFGLPVAEAIACGAPALTSNTTSLPEILDFEPSTFDPADPTAIAAAMERALIDLKFRELLREIGRERTPAYTWSAVAERTVAALGRLQPPARRRSSACRRPRVALVGPMPPARSGIADYNCRLVPELARRCEVDVFSPSRAERASTGPIPGVRHFSTRLLGTRLNPSAYDAITYIFGNSEHHLDTYEAALKYPGLVWLHDVRLTGLYYTYGALRRPEGPDAFLRSKLTQFYGQRVPPHVLEGYAPDLYPQFGIFLSQELVQASRGVIVNSPLAEQFVRLDQGPHAMMPPMWRIPLAVPEPLDVGAIDREEPPVIASFGLVAPVKAPSHLIAAFSLVRREMPARLAFVGPVTHHLRAGLLESATQLGIAGDVHFTGHVEMTEYQRWLRRASCAVQLRLTTNGESSAAINDCLGAGLPVITNMIGAGDEYWNGAVIALDPLLSNDSLATSILEILREPNLRRHTAEAAHKLSQVRTFSSVAESLIAAITGVVRYVH